MKPTYRRTKIYGLLCGAALGLSGTAMANSTAEKGDTAPLPAQVTYSEHIAAIVQKNCLECHRPGEGTPFNFTNYEEVSRKAKLIAHVTGAQYMPPWKVTHSDYPIVSERGLEEREIAMLARWAEQGAPEGDAALTPAAPEYPIGWRLGEPDIVIAMEDAYPVPADGPDIYWNFSLPIPELPEGTWLKGIEFHPGARSVVHHSLFALDSAGMTAEMEAADPGPGYGGMASGLQDKRIGGYAVGTLPQFFPEGVAVSIPDGSRLVLETHFHPSGKAEQEQSTVGLYLTDEAPTRELVGLNLPVAFGASVGLDIPAGEANYTVTHSFTLPVDVHVAQIMPHAHYVCKEMKSVATQPDGTTTTLVHVSDWDFAWQEQYRFAEEIPLPAGTVIDMTFVYDNSAENPNNPHNPPKRITWGPESTDEMASLSLGVVPQRNEDLAALKQSYSKYRVAEFQNIDIDLLRPVIQAQMLNRFDKDGDGTLSWGERMEMFKRARSRMAMANEDETTAELRKVFMERLWKELPKLIGG